MKILPITNCQGPVLFSRFLLSGCPGFRDAYALLPPVQVHLTTEADRPAVNRRFQEADIIVAQPVQRNVVWLTQIDALQEKCAETGKRLILLPALHFTGQTATEVKSAWAGVPGYPFGQTEDRHLAALFVRGLSVAEAVRAFHDDPALSRAELLDGMEQALDEFRRREAVFSYAVNMSDFYAAQWQEARLHHVKSHPCATVYAELARRLAAVLDLPPPDAARIADQRGNDQFALPLKRWVAEALDLRCDDDPEVALFHNAPVPFAEVVEEFWRFYQAQGRAEVARRHQIDGAG